MDKINAYRNHGIVTIDVTEAIDGGLGIGGGVLSTW